MTVEGWLRETEGQLLYNLAKNCTGRGAIVEIGSWKGKSTIYLANGSKAGNRLNVYAIDPHTGSPEHKVIYGKVETFEEFKKNISEAQVDHLIVPILRTSEEAAKSFHQPVELVFIDGAHEYELVKRDFECWFPKVVEGGIMAFHDTIGGWEGPKKVVEESVYTSRYFKNAHFLDSITYAQKVTWNSPSDCFKNRCVLALKKIRESKRKIFLPEPIRTVARAIAKRIN